MNRYLTGLLAVFFFPAGLAPSAWGGCFLPQDPVASGVDRFPDTFLEQLQFRLIGPFRGGRSAAVEGVRGNPVRFYMGASGGGVWQTDDGGNTWRNISDGFFGGSIGAIAVAPSDPNVIYVGGGEVTVRGNVSHGDGIWKSLDAGKSWTHAGLSDSRHVPRLRVDPRDPNTVYAAVLGHLYGPNAERGIYRTRDGGKSWERVLFVNDEVGGCDLVLDPSNPRILYASTWRIRRTPYSLESGGEGSGLWKSSDGGDSWQELSRNDGLPGGTLGIIGVSVSPVNPDRVWAIVEAEEGGLFRSENGGKSWSRINDDRDLRQRAWYYSRVYADPQDVDGVYVVNVSFLHSSDGGRTFRSLRTPHGDHHDLWIDPEDNQRMIVADDGGAQASFNGGETFSTYENQPTAQFYRVASDSHYPWRIYGAQQDNSAIRIAHRGRGAFLTEDDWESTAGGESGHLAPDPLDPEIVYGGSYGGYLSRLNHKTGETRSVDVWPDNPMGHGAIDSRFRFQWNFPVFHSPHDPKKLYAAANVLFRTVNGGHSWEQISPDLTRNDPRRLGPSGGPITRDNTSVEYYCTVFAAAESALEAGVIWAGSDDGLVHVTRDDGKTWSNVTPPEMPEWAQINSLEVSPHQPGALYLAATCYKSDDFRPWLFATSDYGATWRRIDSGIPRDQFTRVVRVDPVRPGLLYAGTERGLFVSGNDGASWQSLQNNFPIVPVTDLLVRDHSLVVATQGRSFWMLDDLWVLRQFQPALVQKAVHVLDPVSVDRIGGGAGRASLVAGANPPMQAEIMVWIRETVPGDPPASLTVRDAGGKTVAEFSGKPVAKSGQKKLELKTGWNRIFWDFRLAPAATFDGLVLWGGGTGGPVVPPGRYAFALQVGEFSQTVHLDLVRDPRSSASDEDLQRQFDFLVSLRDKLSEVHRSIREIRTVRGQLENFAARFAGAQEFAELVTLAGGIGRALTEIEEQLYQTRNRSAQDPLNFPIRLNNRLSALAGVVGEGDNPPTEQAVRVRDEVVGLIDLQLAALRKLVDDDLRRFNERANELKVPLVGGGE